jgi:hypothetical protein
MQQAIGWLACSGRLPLHPIGQGIESSDTLGISMMRLFELDFCGLSARAAIFSGLFLAFLPTHALSAPRSAVHDAKPDAIGIAWDVSGTWRVDGTRQPILAGDAIAPGSLLEPSLAEHGNSITILLPDGQRVLYQCFGARDCARGFRVPELYRAPDAFALRMMERTQAVLANRRSSLAATVPADSPAGRDEVVSILSSGSRIRISGLVSSLSNGRYVYDLDPIRSANPRQVGIPLRKSGPSIAIRVPGPGLYRLRIFDSLKRPRIDDLVAAVRPAEGKKIMVEFQRAESLIEDWNGDYQGWPIDDFQRAYLEALMLNIGPDTDRKKAASARVSLGPDATAEPVFSPRPGVFKGDTPVTLRCASQGAVIHYTFDNSQPFDSSPVYRAPIMVEGTELTIKAYAESPGKKDSAVVTGIFRIANP